MDVDQFDALARHAARHTTRRAALATVMGGVLLLNETGESDATKKAERRRRRERRQQYPRPRYVILRFWNNHRAMNYSTGMSNILKCCEYWKDARLEPYKVLVAQGFSYESPWAWLDDGKYWFQFTNPVGAQPYAEIAINGRYRPSANCCQVIPFGQTVERRLSFARNQTHNLNIAGAIFRIEREPDSEDRMYFNIHIPPNA